MPGPFPADPINSKGKSPGNEVAASGGNLYLCFSRIKGVVSHVTNYFEILCSSFRTLDHLTIIRSMMTSQRANFGK